jgi:hypothetical protein
MELRFVYTASIFCAGFVLGYFVNNKADSDGQSLVVPKISVTKEPILTQQKANPFQLLNSQQSETDEQINPIKTVLTHDNTNQLLEKVDVLDNSEGAESLTAKLAEIGYLVKDNELDKLASGLGDNSVAVRKQTIIGLSYIDSDEALRIIGQALMSDPSAENRMFVVDVLAKRQGLPFVVHFLNHAKYNDPDKQVRQLAAQALEQN